MTQGGLRSPARLQTSLSARGCPPSGARSSPAGGGGRGACRPWRRGRGPTARITSPFWDRGAAGAAAVQRGRSDCQKYPETSSRQFSSTSALNLVSPNPSHAFSQQAAVSLSSSAEQRARPRPPPSPVVVDGGNVYVTDPTTTASGRRGSMHPPPATSDSSSEGIEDSSWSAMQRRRNSSSAHPPVPAPRGGSNKSFGEGIELLQAGGGGGRPIHERSEYELVPINLTYFTFFLPPSFLNFCADLLLLPAKLVRSSQQACFNRSQRARTTTRPRTPSSSSRGGVTSRLRPRATSTLRTTPRRDGSQRRGSRDRDVFFYAVSMSEQFSYM